MKEPTHPVLVMAYVTDNLNIDLVKLTSMIKNKIDAILQKHFYGSKGISDCELQYTNNLTNRGKYIVYMRCLLPIEMAGFTLIPIPYLLHIELPRSMLNFDKYGELLVMPETLDCSEKAK